MTQEQEPVKIVQYNCTCGRTMKFESVHGVVAPQRTWVGLTDEEIEVLFQSAADADEEVHIRFARAIQAKLKELNI